MTRIKTSLAKQLAQPGGRRFEDAVRKADEGLAQRRAEAMAAIGDLIAEIEQMCIGQDPALGSRLYDRATHILDIAGFFPIAPLHGVTLSLCDLADGMLARNMWDWAAVAVHAQALRLVFAGGCGKGAEQLLDGLRAVATRVHAAPAGRPVLVS